MHLGHNNCGGLFIIKGVVSCKKPFLTSASTSKRFAIDKEDMLVWQTFFQGHTGRSSSGSRGGLP